MTSRMQGIVLIALLVSALAGCGSSGAAPKPVVATRAPSSIPASSYRYRYRPMLARVPACTHTGKARAWPAHFPTQFPVLPGTLIDGYRVPVGGGIAASGYVPSRSFRSTVQFFQRQVPRAGFTVLDTEVDAPHDSEGTYAGFGYIGRWALRSLLTGCKGAMFFEVSAVPAKKSK